jgi:hypothetical protein
MHSIHLLLKEHNANRMDCTWWKQVDRQAMGLVGLPCPLNEVFTNHQLEILHRIVLLQELSIRVFSLYFLTKPRLLMLFGDLLHICGTQFLLGMIETLIFFLFKHNTSLTTEIWKASNTCQVDYIL